MRPLAGLAGLIISAALLTACQTTGDEPAAAEPAAAPIAESQQTEALDDTATAALPQPGALPPPIPHIYLALQPGGEGKPTSVIFAIDAARDNTPSDDQAIRLTPENGLCNPQEMLNYNFPPEYAAAPVTSEADQDRGLTAADLPAFMAVSVTETMLARGLASDREQTRALNICTRKLWEELVLAGN
jgi:hypothetical protein